MAVKHEATRCCTARRGPSQPAQPAQPGSWAVGRKMQPTDQTIVNDPPAIHLLRAAAPLLPVYESCHVIRVVGVGG